MTLEYIENFWIHVYMYTDDAKFQATQTLHGIYDTI